MSLRVLAAPGGMRIGFGGDVGTAAAEATGRSLLVLGRRARERLHVDDHDLVVHEIHDRRAPPHLSREYRRRRPSCFSFLVGLHCGCLEKNSRRRELARSALEREPGDFPNWWLPAP